MAAILVVEDDAIYAAGLTSLLVRAGHQATGADGLTALPAIQSSTPDLVLLDYDLGGLTAIDVLRGMPQVGGKIAFPVLVLTGARVDERTEVTALERGAADFIRKGTSATVLLSRIEASLRQSRLASATDACWGRIRTNMPDHDSWEGTRMLDLQPLPMRVLHELVVANGHTVSREALLERVWGTKYRGFDHAVEQAIYSIRRELTDSKIIVTVRGSGWRLAPNAG